jgi:hypothetical protein
LGRAFERPSWRPEVSFPGSFCIRAEQAGDYGIVKLFPKGPNEKADKVGGLVGEVIMIASNKDVKDWKKAGQW